MNFPVPGVLAALMTPIDDAGRVDLAAFDRVIDFVVERGVNGVVVGGGTENIALRYRRSAPTSPAAPCSE